MDNNINGRYFKSNIPCSRLKKIDPKSEEQNKDLKETKGESKQETASNMPQYSIDMFEALDRQNRLQVRRSALATPKCETKKYEPTDVSFVAECISRKDDGYKVDESCLQRNDDGSIKQNDDGSYTLKLVKGNDSVTFTLYGDDALIFLNIGLDVFDEEKKVNEIIEDYTDKLTGESLDKFNEKAEALKQKYMNGDISQKEFKASLAVEFYASQLSDDKAEEFRSSVQTVKKQYEDGEIKLKAFKLSLEKEFNTLNGTQTETTTQTETKTLEDGSVVDIIKTTDSAGHVVKVQITTKDADGNEITIEHIPQVSDGQYAEPKIHEKGGMIWVEDTIYNSDNPKAVGVNFTSYNENGDAVIKYQAIADKRQYAANDNWGSVKLNGDKFEINVYFYDTTSGKSVKKIETDYNKDGKETKSETTKAGVLIIKANYTNYDENGNVKSTTTAESTEPNTRNASFIVTKDDNVIFEYTTHAKDDQIGEVFGLVTADGYTSMIQDLIKDANGKIVKIIYTYFDRDGKVTSTDESTLDADGNTIERNYTYYDEDGIRTYEDTRDADGNTIKKVYTCYDKDGTVKRTTKAEYANQGTSNATVKYTWGNKNVEHKTAAEGDQTGYLSVSYYSDGNLSSIKDVIKDANGKIVKTICTDYDRTGKETKRVIKDANGKTVNIIETYYNKDGKESERRTTDASGYVITEVRTYYDEAGEKTSTVEYTYENNKKVALEITLKNNKTITYTTDANVNEGQSGEVSASIKGDGTIEYIKDTIKDANGKTVKTIKIYYDIDGNEIK